MKLDNKSHWQTDDLRALIRAGAQHLKIGLRGVEFMVGTGTTTRPTAAVAEKKQPLGEPASYSFHLRIPRFERIHASLIDRIGTLDETRGDEAPSAFLRAVATVITQILGKQAGDHSLWSSWAKAEAEATKWLAPELKLRRKVKEVKGRLVGSGLQETKLTDLRTKLAAWERKLKLAQTKVKHYSREIRQREKKLDEALQREGKKFSWPRLSG